jgi:signal transduction histidine kinase
MASLISEPAPSVPPRGVGGLVVGALIIIALVLAFDTSRSILSPTAFSGVRILSAAEAAQAGPDPRTPPRTGWTPVSLPNGWTQQWPHYDGSVWYRMSWTPADTGDAGLMIPWAAFALQVRVNGQELHRDYHMSEPFSRNLGRPVFLPLSASILRPGQNLIEVRVAGLSVHGPGLSDIAVGPRTAVFEAWRWETFFRRELELASIGALLAGVVMYAVLWAVDRHERHHRWFVLWIAAWLWLGQVALSGGSRPFASLDGFERSISIAVTLVIWWLARALMAFYERPSRLIETSLAAAAVVLGSALAFSPLSAAQAVGEVNAAYAGVVITILGLGAAYEAVRTRRSDHIAMAVGMIIALIASLHDVIASLGPARDRMYLLFYAGGALAVASLVAHGLRYAEALQRLSESNTALRHAVTEVRSDMALSLAQTRSRAAAAARQDERTVIAHGLQMGLGEALDDAVEMFEQPDAPREPQAFLSALRELRDDLTLIFEGHGEEGERMPTLAEVLGPLRRRWVMDLGLEGVACRWPLESTNCRDLGPTRNLDLMRLINRALANVAAHAAARTVRVSIDSDDTVVTVRIQDDGRGFDPAAAAASRGLQSMRNLAARLGGVIDIKSRPGAGATVRIIAPIRPSRQVARRPADRGPRPGRSSAGAAGLA